MATRTKARNGLFSRLWERGARVRAVFRVLVYLTFVFSVLAFFSLRSAYGDVQEQALFIGKQLSELDDLVGGSYRLELNGERIYVASATTDQPVSRVLDRFEQVCKQAGTGLAEEFQKLDTETKKDFALDTAGDGSSLGILREERDGEGVVACLARGPEHRKVSVFERLSRFSASRDLGDVGWLRYAYARATDNGRTHVVTSWTEGSFLIDRLAPVDGSEPPGSDPANAPRPDHSVRLLTAEIIGAPHAVRVYDSQTSWQAMLNTFDQGMIERGWRRMPYVAEEVPTARAYEREGVDLLVFAHEKPEGSVATIVETRSK